MREQFPWFLDPTEEELQRLWDEATFSFDANVLLNLYRVDKETTEDYFKIFRALGDRIFLPHEAAHQFFRNRRRVIRTEQNSFSEAKKRVRDWVGRRTGFDNLKQQLRGGDIGQIIEDEIESVFEDREDYEGEVEAVKDDLIERIEDLEERFTPTGTTRANAEEDRILGELMDIFAGKTGSELDGNIEDLKDKAQERYEKEKPPGYEDYNGEEELSRGECEDFLIWKQLMEFAERDGEDVVFITGDEKYDWWEKADEHNLVRPSHELLREFRRETGQVFWMLTIENMIDTVDDRLGVDVKPKSANQTTKVSGGEADEEPMEEIDKIGNLISVFSGLSECLKDARHNIVEERWSVSDGIVYNANRYYEKALKKEKLNLLSKEKMSKIAPGLEGIEKCINDRNKSAALEKEKEVRSVTNQILEGLADERSRVTQKLFE